MNFRKFGQVMCIVCTGTFALTAATNAIIGENDIDLVIEKGDDPKKLPDGSENEHAMTRADYKYAADGVCMIVAGSGLVENWATSEGEVVYLPNGGVDFEMAPMEADGGYDYDGNWVDGTKVGGKFHEELTVAANLGSGFAIENRLVMTAAHVVEGLIDEDYDVEKEGQMKVYCVFQHLRADNDHCVSFGWDEDQNPIPCMRVNPSYDVYTVTGLHKPMFADGPVIRPDKERIKDPDGKEGRDVAILELDRCVRTPARTLNVAQKTDYSTYIGEKELYMIGHPFGIPLAVSDNAFVTHYQPDQYLFHATFDGFGGFSGSPVFVKDASNAFVVVGVYITGFGRPEWKLNYDEEGEAYWGLFYLSEEERKKTPPNKFPGVTTLEGLRWDNNLTCPRVEIQAAKPNEGTIKNGRRGKRVKLHYGQDGSTGGVEITDDDGGDGVSGQGKPYSPLLLSFVPQPEDNGVIEFYLPVATESRLYYREYDREEWQELSPEQYEIFPDDEKYYLGRTYATVEDKQAITEAAFRMSNTGGEGVPHSVSFAAFTPIDKSVASYYWEFGDGSTSTEQSPLHTFHSAGVFQISLTLTYLDGTETTVLGQQPVTIVQSPVQYISGLHEKVSPVLEYVARECDGSYTAHYGYYNRNSFPVIVDYGDLNKFTPDCGSLQPEVFSPGRHRDVFTVDLVGERVVWKLTTSTATASRAAATDVCQ